MADNELFGIEEGADRRGLDTTRMAAAFLIVMASLFGLVITAGAVLAFAHFSKLPAAQGGLLGFAGTTVVLLAGWCFSLLLWGGAEVLNRLRDLTEAPRGGAALPGLGDSASASRLRPLEGTGDDQGRLMRELIDLTREVRDIGLLSDEERSARLEREGQALVASLEREVPRLLREHAWQEAQRRVRQARQRFPSLSSWDALEKQVEEARAKFESDDLENAARELEDLIALAAWDRAAQVVRDSQQRHPRSERTSELARRLANARARASAEERARLMARAQDATNRRDWSEALRLVQTLLARYPGSPESHELRQQVVTLRDNAEIQKRQQMEKTIRALVAERRYAEALRISRELVSQYPESPQAKALSEQIPRLERMAGSGR
jgi:hypothetical protein